MTNKVIDGSNITKYSQLLKEYIDSKQTSGEVTTSNLRILNVDEYNYDSLEPTITDIDADTLYIVPVYKTISKLPLDGITVLDSKPQYSSCELNVKPTSINKLIVGNWDNYTHTITYTLQNMPEGKYKLYLNILDKNNMGTLSLLVDSEYIECTPNMLIDYDSTIYNNELQFKLEYTKSSSSSVYPIFEITFDIIEITQFLEFLYIDDTWVIQTPKINNGLSIDNNNLNIGVPSFISYEDGKDSGFKINDVIPRSERLTYALMDITIPDYAANSNYEIKVYADVYENSTETSDYTELKENGTLIEATSSCLISNNYHIKSVTFEKVVEKVNKIEAIYKKSNIVLYTWNNIEQKTNGLITLEDKLLLDNIKYVDYNDFDYYTNTFKIEGTENYIYAVPQVVELTTDDKSKLELNKTNTGTNGYVGYYKDNDIFSLSGSYNVNYGDEFFGIITLDPGYYYIKMTYVSGSNTYSNPPTSLTDYTLIDLTNSNLLIRGSTYKNFETRFKLDIRKIVGYKFYIYKDGRFDKQSNSPHQLSDSEYNPGTGNPYINGLNNKLYTYYNSGTISVAKQILREIKFSDRVVSKYEDDILYLNIKYGSHSTELVSLSELGILPGSKIGVSIEHITGEKDMISIYLCRTNSLNNSTLFLQGPSDGTIYPPTGVTGIAINSEYQEITIPDDAYYIGFMYNSIGDSITEQNFKFKFDLITDEKINKCWVYNNEWLELTGGAGGEGGDGYTLIGGTNQYNPVEFGDVGDFKYYVLAILFETNHRVAGTTIIPKELMLASSSLATSHVVYCSSWSALCYVSGDKVYGRSSDTSMRCEVWGVN